MKTKTEARFFPEANLVKLIAELICRITKLFGTLQKALEFARKGPGSGSPVSKKVSTVFIFSSLIRV